MRIITLVQEFFNYVVLSFFLSFGLSGRQGHHDPVLQPILQPTLFIAKSFQFTPPPNSSTSLLTISFHLNVGLSKGLFPTGFCSNTILNRAFWLLITCPDQRSLPFLIVSTNYLINRIIKSVNFTKNLHKVQPIIIVYLTSALCTEIFFSYKTKRNRCNQNIIWLSNLCEKKNLMLHYRSLL